MAAKTNSKPAVVDDVPRRKTDGTPISRLTRRLTPEDEQQIIDMKMNRVSTTAICKQMERNPRTVKRVWDKHLDKLAKDREGQNERQRIIALQRLDQIAIDARHGAIAARESRNIGAEQKFLTLEERTIIDMARLDGLALDRVEVSGTVGVVAVHITEQVHYPEPEQDVIDVTPED